MWYVSHSQKIVHINFDMPPLSQIVLRFTLLLLYTFLVFKERFFHSECSIGVYVLFNIFKMEQK
jgi:hypothetical protein